MPAEDVGRHNAVGKVIGAVPDLPAAEYELDYRRCAGSTAMVLASPV